MKLEKLLASYPRQRPPLSEAHRSVYAAEYALNRSGKGNVYSVVERLESWMHKKIAQESSEGPLLELGAGGLNHVPYEMENGQDYDVLEPLGDLCRKNSRSGCIRRIYEDYGMLASLIGTAQYHRIFSVAVLEHLTNLPLVVACSGLLLRDDGLFQAGIPSEGSVLWWIGWRFGTGIPYRFRTGLSYKTIMRHEHINGAPEILAIVSHFFRRIKVVRWPLPVFHLSFYTYLRACKPNRNVCRAYIQGMERNVGP